MGSWRDRLTLSLRRVQVTLLPLVILASAFVVARVVNRHYRIGRWLFWAYVAYWLLTALFSLSCLSAGHASLRLVLRRRPLPLREHVVLSAATGVLLFALSTCGWCQKTKNLLKELGIAFDYVYVDLLPADEMRSTLQLVEKYNPAGSFPTLIINDTKTIVGFREEDIRGALRE
jgi:glutaredoxin-like protein NrdH